MTIQSGTLTATIIIVLFGSIGFGQLSGYWQTESSKIPATYEEGEFVGEANPGDIRGSYTFADVEAAFGVSAAVLGDAFGVSEPETFAIRGLEELYGEINGMEIGTDSVRLFVALFLDRPYEPEEATGLPNTALPFLPAAARSTMEYRAVDVQDAGSAPQDTGTNIDDAAEGERLVRGMTTVAELLSWGLNDGEIASFFGGSLPSPSSMTLREASEAAAVEFSVIKDRIQDLVDSK